MNMKKLFILLVFLSLFILSSCSFWIWWNTEVSTLDNKVSTNVYVSNYMSYTKDSLSSIKWDILLFFHADWCPTCKNIEKNIIETWLPEWLTILKVDYDNASDLRKKYGITSQSTFVQVDNDWNMLKKWMWTTTVDDIIGNIE